MTLPVTNETYPESLTQARAALAGVKPHVSEIIATAVGTEIYDGFAADEQGERDVPLQRPELSAEAAAALSAAQATFSDLPRPDLIRVAKQAVAERYSDAIDDMSPADRQATIFNYSYLFSLLTSEERAKVLNG